MERGAVRAGVRAAKNVRTSAQPVMLAEGTLLPQARGKGSGTDTQSVPPASRGEEHGGTPSVSPRGPPSDTFALAFACGIALQTSWFKVAEAPAKPAPPRFEN